MSAGLEKLEAAFARKTKPELAAIDAELIKATGHLRWVPNPGPQTEAYFSKADVILYGGQPGGGKTDLVLGLAFNEHKRALVMRRRYTDLSGIVDRMIAMNGGKDGFNGSPPPSLKTKNLVIELGAANNPGDEQSWIGRARDLLGIDEATQFTEAQVRMLMGWVRSENPKQRCRTILATNPPLTSEGLWVIQMFAPWLDDTYPRPAKAGELRWVVSDDDGDRWVDGPRPVEVTQDGQRKVVTPTSRTYIASSVGDNPFYVRSGYQKQLDALPAQIRRILMGGFKASFQDAENQVIPTAWIRDAQRRWTKTPPLEVPMCAIGVDMSGGGTDPMVLAPRRDGWYAPLVVVPAKSIPQDKASSFAFGQILIHRRDHAIIVLDMSGGYGSGCFQLARENSIDVFPYKGAAKSAGRTKDKQLGFFNTRSEAIWKFREALDPDQDGGSIVALPDDPELVADLTAPRLDMEFRVGIKVESKEEVCARLGRSTNKGDAAVMSWFRGPKALHTMVRGGAYGEFGEFGGARRRVPQVIMGRQHDRH
jgi:hypothetical protein